MFRIARAPIVSILLVTGCAQDNGRATCTPLDDASGIACTSTVAACISDGGGVCEIKLADFTLDLNVDGTYSAITSRGPRNGTWTQSGDTITLTNAADLSTTTLTVSQQ